MQDIRIIWHLPCTLRYPNVFCLELHHQFYFVVLPRFPYFQIFKIFQLFLWDVFDQFRDMFYAAVQHRKLARMLRKCPTFGTNIYSHVTLHCCRLHRHVKTVTNAPDFMASVMNHITVCLTKLADFALLRFCNTFSDRLQAYCFYIFYNNNNNNKFIYLLQLGCYPVAVVILHVNKT